MRILIEQSCFYSLTLLRNHGFHIKELPNNWDLFVHVIEAYFSHFLMEIFLMRCFQICEFLEDRSSVLSLPLQYMAECEWHIVCVL